MCGIVGSLGQGKTTSTAIEALKRLEYRGYDSFGVSVMGVDTITTKKAIGSVTEHSQKNYFAGLPEGVSSIAHTRWATHGGVTAENAHPHTSMDGAFSLVHNGVIDNYRTLRAQLEKCLGCCTHKKRIRIHFDAGDVFDEVGLEEH